MAGVAQTTSHEYWRPSNPDVARLSNPPALLDACWRCGMDYSAGAHFCYICGSKRDPRPLAESASLIPSSNWWDLGRVRQRIGLSTACLTFFLLGMTCMLGGALTGILDWQAVQMGPMEWFLAATAALLAGVLLKKNASA